MKNNTSKATTITEKHILTESITINGEWHDVDSADYSRLHPNGTCQYCHMKTKTTTEGKIRNILRKHQEHGVRYAIDDIMQLIQQEKAALPEELKIGDLRQWLNEDRIRDANKFVTNGQIEFMLGLAHSQVLDIEDPVRAEQRSEDREGKGK